jgi:hypothetical protein
LISFGRQILARIYSNETEQGERTMSRHPIEEWEAAAAEVRARLSATKVRPRFEGNPMAELAPEFAELIQTVARGRSYADPTLDLKTRALSSRRRDTVAGLTPTSALPRSTLRYFSSTLSSR